VVGKKAARYVSDVSLSHSARAERQTLWHSASVGDIRVRCVMMMMMMMMVCV
jgi:hypothetical protein